MSQCVDQFLNDSSLAGALQDEQASWTSHAPIRVQLAHVLLQVTWLDGFLMATLSFWAELIPRWALQSLLIAWHTQDAMESLNRRDLCKRVGAALLLPLLQTQDNLILTNADLPDNLQALIIWYTLAQFIYTA